MVKYSIMESKIYNWKYTIIREMYVIIFWNYTIIDSKVYYSQKLWFAT